jgi:hypothetical protein
LHDIEKNDSKSIVAENTYHNSPDPPAGGPHDIGGPPTGGPHGIGDTHCPGPGYEGSVQCRGGDGQYPAPRRGPHGIDGPPNADPHNGGHIGGCPPPGDHPYGIVIDA